MSSNTQPTKEPLNEKTFDLSNLVVGSESKNEEYKFSKFYIKYKYPDTTSDDAVICLKGVKVRKAFPPFKSKDGKVSTYPKVFVLFELANDEQLDLINSLLDYTDKSVFEKRSSFAPLEDYETLEELVEEGALQKRDSIFRNPDDPRVIGVSFPLEGMCADGDKQMVNIVYRDPVNKPNPDVITCGDIDVMLPRDSICDILFQPQCIKVNWQGGGYTLMTTIHKRINVTSYATPGQGNGTKKITGVDLDKFDTDTIVLGKRDPEEKRRIKPKMEYTTSKGEDKLRSISVNVKSADIYLSRRENTNESGEKSYSWSMAVSLDDEQAKVIEAIETKLYDDFIENSAELMGVPKKKTKKRHPMGTNDKASFRVALRPPGEKSDKSTVWIAVFAKNQGADVPDFCGNFYKPGSSEELYTDEEVMDIIANRRHTNVDLNMYIKHIWFLADGNVQTVKWSLGNATIDPTSVGGNFNVGEETSMFSDVTMGGEGSAFTDVGKGADTSVVEDTGDESDSGSDVGDANNANNAGNDAESDAGNDAGSNNGSGSGSDDGAEDSSDEED